MITGGTKWNQRDFSKGLAENVGFIFFYHFIFSLYIGSKLKAIEKKKRKSNRPNAFFFYHSEAVFPR